MILKTKICVLTIFSLRKNNHRQSAWYWIAKTQSKFYDKLLDIEKSHTTTVSIFCSQISFDKNYYRCDKFGIGWWNIAYNFATENAIDTLEVTIVKTGYQTMANRLRNASNSCVITHSNHGINIIGQIYHRFVFQTSQHQTII